MLADEHQHTVVHDAGLDPRSHHGHKPFFERIYEKPLQLFLKGFLVGIAVEHLQGRMGHMHHVGHTLDGTAALMGVVFGQAIEISDEGIEFGHNLAHQHRPEHVARNITLCIYVTVEHHGIDVAVCQFTESVRKYNFARNFVEEQPLSADPVGTNPHLHIGFAMIFRCRAGQLFQSVGGGGGLVAAGHKAVHPLIVIHVAIGLLHHLGGSAFGHAEIREQHGQRHEIVVAVARGEIACSRAFHIFLGQLEHTVFCPPLGPCFLRLRLFVHQGFLGIFLLQGQAHIDLQRFGIGIEPGLTVVAERSAVNGRLHLRVEIGHNGLGNLLVALAEGLPIHLGRETRIGYLVGIEHMQSVATHRLIIHGHEGQLLQAAFGLGHAVGREAVDVGLAAIGIGLDTLLLAAALAHGGGKHQGEGRLHLLQGFGGQFGIQGLAVGLGAIPQFHMVHHHVEYVFHRHHVMVQHFGAVLIKSKCFFGRLFHNCLFLLIAVRHNYL